MKLALTVLAWLMAVVLFIMAIALWFMGGALQAVLVALAAFLILPPAGGVLRLLTIPVPAWSRVVGALVLIAGMVAVTMATPATSIYKSPQVADDMSAIYREKLAEWPVPYDEVQVPTSLGRIHVIVSGPEDAPPLMLLHASAMSGWSWQPNVAALAARFRVYMPDNPGEVGLNQDIDLSRIPTTTKDIAAYVAELADGLGIERAHVAGASIGGFIATAYALERPERVERLALLGSMGYGDTARTVTLMVLAQAFPLPQLQDWTLKWALGDSPAVAEAFGDWFRLVLNGTAPHPIPPTTLTPAGLSHLNVPTLAVFGTRDDVIGPAEAASELALNIPVVEVITLDSGHLIAAERPEETNGALLRFFGG